MSITGCHHRSSRRSQVLSPGGDPFAIACRLQRQELGLTRQQAAERAGMSLEQWDTIEQGTWVPQDLPELKAVARVLEADPVKLFLLAVFEPLPKQ